MHISNITNYQTQKPPLPPPSPPPSPPPLQALSDAHTHLFEERQRLLDIQAENDELKLQELEDRKRIQHLLALTEPVEQEITYARCAKADTFKLLPRNAPDTKLAGVGCSTCAPSNDRSRVVGRTTRAQALAIGPCRMIKAKTNSRVFVFSGGCCLSR